MGDQSQFGSSLGKGQLGLLRFEPPTSGGNQVMSGSVRCPACSRVIDAVVHRNVNAVTDKQPAFLLFDAGDVNRSRQLGHLFVGTIRTSPVLYYGALQHCGVEHRTVAFFNRAFRVASDPQLALAAQTSGGGEPTEKDVPF